jgi:RNA polymerase sigma-70 factor, ECF subfamily
LLARKQTAEQVQTAVAGLPERQRAAIALVHYDGFSNIEAAAVLEVQVEALESLLARGRRTLRDKLAGLRADTEVIE